ncbi:MAG: hypothetical protein J5542_03450, partial [Bacteroidales bacterium]|nr:hypothetical protein [Bacteroidales bacterium]
SWTFFRLKLSLKLLLCLSSTVNFSIVDLFYFTVLVNKNGQPISGIDKKSYLLIYKQLLFRVNDIF